MRNGDGEEERAEGVIKNPNRYIRMLSVMLR